MDVISWNLNLIRKYTGGANKEQFAFLINSLNKMNINSGQLVCMIKSTVEQRRLKKHIDWFQWFNSFKMISNWKSLSVSDFLTVTYLRVSWPWRCSLENCFIFLWYQFHQMESLRVEPGFLVKLLNWVCFQLKLSLPHGYCQCIWMKSTVLKFCNENHVYGCLFLARSII